MSFDWDIISAIYACLLSRPAVREARSAMVGHEPVAMVVYS
jgi:hypothetical protein